MAQPSLLGFQIKPGMDLGAFNPQVVALPPPETFQPEAMLPPKTVDVNGAKVATAPTPVVDAVTTAKPKDIVDGALEAGDTKTLKNYALQNPGTSEGEAASRLAGAFEKGNKEAIQFVGDLNTPEGRLRAAETYKKDPVRYGDAMMAYIAGDKTTAFNIITGGALKTEVRYLPDSGRMVEVKTNALGNLVSVIDTKSGVVIPKNEYAALGGSISALENTIAFKNKEANRKFNTEEFNKSNAAMQNIGAASVAKSPLVDEHLEIMKEFMNTPGMSKEDRITALNIASAQVNLSKSLQKTRQILDQFTAGKGSSVDASDRKLLEGTLGPNGFKINANNEIVDASGTKVSNQKLDQLMDTQSNNATLDRSYTQQQANLVAAVQAGILSNEQFIKLQRALQLSTQIEKINADVATKYGNPVFTVPTANADMLDQAHRPVAQALQEKFNIEAVGLFNVWKEDQLKMARLKESNFVPTPGQLENAFTKTDEYKGLQKKYSKEIKDVINTPYLQRKESAVGESLNVLTKPESQVSATVLQKKSPIAEGTATMEKDQAAMKAKEEARQEKLAKEKRARDLRKEHTN
jgi:hypothetical protein